ncbi:hypothetical protein Are01nite_70940 [Actinoplanes regularis]|nr:hypothetical protein Are01nite_70940 [Actinoplanes regularis]
MLGMALLHKAEIRPSKLELLSGWLPTLSWSSVSSGTEVSRVAAARFDDPAGAVGIEILLVRAGDGPVLQVPLTYRGAPLAGAERFLVGTTEHSVLGPRWVYDACGDPVFASVLGDVIRTGAGQAAEEVHGDGRVVVRQPNLVLLGSGCDAPPVGEIRQVSDGEVTRIGTTAGTLEILRTPSSPAVAGEAVLTGKWADVETPLVLARLTS